MDSLTFVAEIVKALAWPGSLLIVFLLFRKPLLELIPAIKQLKIKELEFNFDRQLSKVESHSVRSKKPPPLTEGKDHGDFEQLWQVAEISPKAAILEAWLSLEAAAAEVAAERGWTVTGGPWQLFHVLEKEGVLKTGDLNAINELRELRNQAAHVPDLEISSVQAIRYIELAQMLRPIILLGKLPD